MIKKAEFIMEEKPERTSFSVRFFDENGERILACFFTKMYDEKKNLLEQRKKIYDDMLEKYGQKIEFP
jgi:putative heme iron utilization protein